MQGNKVSELKDEFFKEEFADFEVTEDVKDEEGKITEKGDDDLFHWAREVRSYTEKGTERDSKPQVFSSKSASAYEHAKQFDCVVELLHAPEGYEEEEAEESAETEELQPGVSTEVGAEPPAPAKPEAPVAVGSEAASQIAPQGDQPQPEGQGPGN